MEAKRQISEQELNDRFDYHAIKPGTGQAEAYATSRIAFKTLARFVWENIPEGREKNLVLTHLEEASFFANAAIARRT